MPDAVIDAAELEHLAAAALAAGGMAAEDAALAAQVLVLADLFGIRTHGISRVPQYLARVPLGGIDPQAEITVERLAPGLLAVDGANGIGPLVGMRALQAALEAAGEVGIAAAFVRGSNHFGPIMPYAFLAAQQGFASIIASNASTTLAPWGGKDARLGNNPIGFGMPDPNGDPVMLDVALSVAARAKIRNALRDGRKLPEGWATDAEGKPTTDPAAALKGFLLPIAGHKGYGLSVMVDLFAGMLSGAGFLTRVSSWSDDPGAPQNLGHVFILVDAKKMAAADVLRARMADFRGVLKETPAADPAQPVLLPGEIEMARYHRQRATGVAVDAADLASLRGLVENAGK